MTTCFCLCRIPIGLCVAMVVAAIARGVYSLDVVMHDERKVEMKA